jgi:hypothetical protein
MAFVQSFIKKIPKKLVFLIKICKKVIFIKEISVKISCFLTKNSCFWPTVEGFFVSLDLV